MSNLLYTLPAHEATPEETERYNSMGDGFSHPNPAHNAFIWRHRREQGFRYAEKQSDVWALFWSLKTVGNVSVHCAIVQPLTRNLYRIFANYDADLGKWISIATSL